MFNKISTDGMISYGVSYKDTFKLCCLELLHIKKGKKIYLYP